VSDLTVEGFSISHAAILDGTTLADAVDGDIYGVQNGALTPNTSSFENTGDDNVLSTWYWLTNATVNITAGYIPFKLLALLSGETITSSGTSPNDYYSIPMWTETSSNQPARPMLLRVPSKDKLGAVRSLDIVLYKVQFQPFGLTGPTYKNGLTLDYTGTALISSVDETGSTLAKKTVGRLISRPAA
jgi:hypothetical protein